MGNYKTMKTRLLIVFLIILPTISFGQNLNDSLLVTFYNKTLTYYFSDSIPHPDQKKFACLLVKTDFQTARLIKSIGPNKFKYVNDNTHQNKVLVWPYRRNNGRSLYWINHKLIGNDTLDVNIGGWTLEQVRRKKMNIAAWCGGTMGYIPTGRFIYNKVTGIWLFTTSSEIIAQKKEEYKLKQDKE
jgi:hypothetical protein